MVNNKRAIALAIIKRYRDRTRKNIEYWLKVKDQISDPMYPSREDYRQLVKDLKSDGHLISQRGIRKLTFLSKKYRIMKPDGTENTEATALLKRPWFHTVRDKYCETKVDGTEVIEIQSMENGEIKEIKVFDKGRLVPEKKRVKLNHWDLEGVSYDDPEHWRYIFELGDPEEHGFMIDLAHELIWKRNSEQSWSEFADLFGKPLRTATTNKKRGEDWDEIEEMLELMGETGYALFPEGTQYQLVADKRQDAYNVYLKRVELCNSEISKGINFVTMLSDEGSSRAQAGVHLEVNEKVIEADMEQFENEVNSDIIPKLRYLGGAYTIIGANDRFEFDRTESLSKKDLWEIVNALMTHKEVPNDYIEKTFGIPVTDKIQTQEGNFNPGSGSAAPQNLFRVEQLLHPLPNACTHDHGHVIMRANTDPYSEELERIAQLVANQESVAAVPSSVYMQYSRLLLQAFRTGFKTRLGAMDYASPDNYRVALFQANIFRFSAANTWKDVLNMNRIAQEANNADEFVRMARSYTSLKSHYARTEFNVGQATAENGANFLRQWEDREDYDLIFQTAGDGQVRKKHAELDETVVATDDPILNTMYTPLDYGCRCEWDQVPKGSRRLTPSSEIDKSIAAKGFKFNPGKVNMIFDQSHEYFNEFPDTTTMNHQSFGLKSLVPGRNSALTRLPENITTQEDFSRELQNKANNFDGKSAFFQDMLGRWFNAPVKKFDSKFKKPDKAQRWSALDILDEMILNPDEVWITEKNQRHTTRFLKNYQDKTMVVEAVTKKDQMEITDWYPLDQSEELLDAQRTGLIIHQSNQG